MAVSRSSTPMCTCKPNIRFARATSCISSTIFLYRSPGVISCMRQSAKGCVAAEHNLKPFSLASATMSRRSFLTSSSVVEVGTAVCNNIKDAKEEVKKLRRDMVALAKENGLRLCSAATHPFADWRMQEITPGERYKYIVEDMQLVARANLIFGLHVHIGVEDRETAIQLMNHARYFLPHILALS